MLFVYLFEVVEYVLGEFYCCELLCLLWLVEVVVVLFFVVVVDGYVMLGEDVWFGFGWKLWEVLGCVVLVVGVVKIVFVGMFVEIEVWCGGSYSLLYVIVVGLFFVDVKV